MKDKIRPPIISSFEKLVIAQSYIKQLRVEKGELLAFIDELKYEIEKLKQTPRIPIDKADARIILLNKQIQKQKTLIESQYKSISDLIMRLNRK